MALYMDFVAFLAEKGLFYEFFLKNAMKRPFLYLIVASKVARMYLEARILRKHDKMSGGLEGIVDIFI